MGGINNTRHSSFRYKEREKGFKVFSDKKNTATSTEIFLTAANRLEIVVNA